MPDTGRPLFVKTNGDTEVVVLSPEAYDELLDKVEILEGLVNIERSMEGVRRGCTQAEHGAFRDTADELGIDLDPCRFEVVIT